MFAEAGEQLIVKRFSSIDSFNHKLVRRGRLVNITTAIFLRFSTVFIRCSAARTLVAATVLVARSDPRIRLKAAARCLLDMDATIVIDGDLAAVSTVSINEGILRGVPDHHRKNLGRMR
jgi:hypothetical protein